jgi:tetratricopeptide (TPR) repeat protein
MRDNIDQLRSAIAKNPADTKSLYQLGKIEMEAKHYDAAERALQQAIGFAPSNPDYLVAMGQIVLANVNARGKGDRLQKAQTLFAHAVRLSPKHASALYGLAYLAAEQQQFDKADAYCKNLLSIAPRDSASHRLRIGLLDRSNTTQSREAVKVEFDRYLRLVPQDSDSLLRYLGLLNKEIPSKDAKPPQVLEWRQAMMGRVLGLIEANVVGVGASAPPKQLIRGEIEKLYLATAPSARRQAFMQRLETQFPTRKNILMFLATLSRRDLLAGRSEARAKTIAYYQRALVQDNTDRHIWFALAQQYELQANKEQSIRAYSEVARQDQADLIGKSSVEALKMLKAPIPMVNSKK